MTTLLTRSCNTAVGLKDPVIMNMNFVTVWRNLISCLLIKGEQPVFLTSTSMGNQLVDLTLTLTGIGSLIGS